MHGPKLPLDWSTLNNLNELHFLAIPTNKAWHITKFQACFSTKDKLNVWNKMNLDIIMYNENSNKNNMSLAGSSY